MVESNNREPQEANGIVDNYKTERLKYIDEVGNQISKQYLQEAEDRVNRGQAVKDKFLETIEIANSAYKKFSAILQ